AARPHVTRRQDAQNRRKHAFTPQSRLSQVTRDRRAQLRQRLRKLRQPFELSRFLKPRVIRVIEVLPTTRRVFPDRLQTAFCRRIYEDIGPRRRNAQRLNAIEICFRQTTTHGSIPKPTLRSTEPLNSVLLESFEVRH